MLLNVLKKCSKNRICPDDQFLIQQKDFLIALNVNTFTKWVCATKYADYVGDKFGYGPNRPRR